MSKLELTFACGPYDRMEALQYGASKSRGLISVTWKFRRHAKSLTAWSVTTHSTCPNCPWQNTLA